MFVLIDAEYAYRRQYQPRLRALGYAIRAGIYSELRRWIEWINPPRVSYEEWRAHQRPEGVPPPPPRPESAGPGVDIGSYSQCAASKWRD